jgi:hypothetical protein
MYSIGSQLARLDINALNFSKFILYSGWARIVSLETPSLKLSSLMASDDETLLFAKHSASLMTKPL